MSNPSSFTKELWACGWPLDEAAHRIAPRELLDQLEEPYPAIDRPAPIELPSDSGWPLRALAATAVISEALGPILDHYLARSAVRDEIRDNLLVRIEGGQFIAVGYALPRKHGDLPVEIPIDLWEGEPDWNNSSISEHGLEYVAVQIVPAERLEKLPGNIALLQIAPPSASPRKINPPRIGRPSCRKIIEIAYEKLKQSREIDYLAPQIIAIRQIRDAVIAVFLNDIEGDRGLGDEAIRRVICEDFRRARDALKTASKL